jgi:hypothetical protein
LRAASLCRLAAQLFHSRNDGLFGGEVAERLHPLHTFPLGALALPCGPELQHRHVLVELGDSPENLSNEASRRVIRAGQVHAVSGQDLPTQFRKLTENDFLDHQIAGECAASTIPAGGRSNCRRAGEAIGALDQYRADILAFAEHVIGNGASLGTNASAQDRLALQRAPLPNGLTWDGSGFGTVVTCLAFNQFEGISGQNQGWRPHRDSNPGFSLERAAS